MYYYYACKSNHRHKHIQTSFSKFSSFSLTGCWLSLLILRLCVFLSSGLFVSSEQETVALCSKIWLSVIWPSELTCSSSGLPLCTGLCLFDLESSVTPVPELQGEAVTSDNTLACSACSCASCEVAILSLPSNSSADWFNSAIWVVSFWDCTLSLVIS